MTGLVFYYQNDTKLPAFELLHNVIQLSGEHRISNVFNEFNIDAYVLADDPESRTIAIDWDNTITADIDFYLDLIDAFVMEGWKPVICTLRDAGIENLDEIHTQLYNAGIRIYTTDGVPKHEYMRAEGVSVNLWIDDYFPGVCLCGDPLLLNNGIDY